MSISFVAKTTAESDSAVTSISIDKPTGVADGDVLILIASIGHVQTWNNPSDWTQIGSEGGTDLRTRAWYKVASSEGSSYTLNWSGGSSAVCAAVVAYRGCDTMNPINVQGSTPSSSKTATTPTVATTANCWMVYTRTIRDDTASDTNVATSWASATERADEQFAASASSSVSHGVSIADNAAKVSAGSQSGATSSSGTSTPTESYLRTIGLAVGGTTATGGKADATGTAEAPTTTLAAKPVAGVAHATATLFDHPRNVSAGVAEATGSVTGSTIGISVSAGLASVTVAMLDPTHYARPEAVAVSATTNSPILFFGSSRIIRVAAQS